MIIECDQSQKRSILDYIGNDYGKCAYLYLDLLKYAFHHEYVRVWANIDSIQNILMIALSYYDCLHLYSRDNTFNRQELSDMIMKIRPKVMFMPEGMMEILKDDMTIAYDYQYSTVLYMDEKNDIERGLVSIATIKDIPEIAQLIISDEAFSQTYTVDNLERQMNERYQHGFTRHHIIRSEGKIIAHYATLAESVNLAIAGLFVVDRNYRGKGYGKKVAVNLFNTLVDEGKTAILFPINEKSLKLHLKIGHKNIGRIVRLSRKDN